MKRTKKEAPSYERQIHLDLSSSDHCLRLGQISRALSSEARTKMLQLLHSQALSPSELSAYFKLPLSSVIFNLKLLEESGLIVQQSQRGQRGGRTVASATIDLITVAVKNTAAFPKGQNISVEMPIGDYYDCQVQPSCGIAGENGVIGTLDDPGVFFSVERKEAQLIWFQHGFIEYRFPNNFPCIREKRVKKLSFSLEICSEVSGFSDTWPSDIGLFINGIEVALYHSPGDFGGRKGKLTPEGWGYGSTQYGILKTFTVTDRGSFNDENFIEGSPCLKDLKLDQGFYTSLKIESLPKAKHPGGVNLFGAKYGDHPQDIIFSLGY